MSRHDDGVRLRHMLEHAREAVELAVDRTSDDLKNDRLRQLALVRLIEIVGEAAARVSPETRERHPEIPWSLMVGTRNRLIHGYDIVDHEILWATIQKDLPPLIAALERFVGPETEPDSQTADSAE
jgi:uncharacterized protein with HEPN domain